MSCTLLSCDGNASRPMTLLFRLWGHKPSATDTEIHDRGLYAKLQVSELPRVMSEGQLTEENSGFQASNFGWGREIQEQVTKDRIKDMRIIIVDA